MSEEAGTHFAGRMGYLEPFDESSSDWASYDERLTSFLIVNGVPESDKVHAFLSIIGPKTYALLKSLTAPELPSTKSFEYLKKALGDHLSPKPSIIGERAKFHRRAQHEGESISEYVAELRKLSQTCDYGSVLDESLRDRFVCGLLREDIQRVLFTEYSKLTFQKAVERAQAMEAAKQSAAEARVGNSSVTDVHKVQAGNEKQRDSCYRCGSSRHRSQECPHRQSVCHKCDKKGHIQRVCRSGTDVGGKKRPPGKRVKTLEVEGRLAVVHGVSSPSLTPVTVEMVINGSAVEMELDTGAAVTVMSAKQFHQSFPSVKLTPTVVRLRTYTGALVRLQGVATVNVQHALRKNKESAPLHVKLQTFLQSYRNTAHATTNESPANLFLGRRLRSRLDVVKPSVGERVARKQFLQTASRRGHDRDFAVGDHVLIRNYCGKPKWVPGVILAQHGPVSYQVRATTSRGSFTWRRHKDQLLRTPSLVDEDADQEGTEFLLVQPSDNAPQPSSSSPTGRTVPAEAAQAPAARRYPTRTRKPSERFQAGS
ncbi:uncharacterized protein LOC115320361 [Ixodes scapularis]|uniref:uncharacterized protein LOC115320361 n=1 Tax=Ixodes scapularis TaxID=6945 RepID=UPI001A9FC72A|nr:uncharacterized protein LOC115320361 [Ixodes scapularis]